MAFLRQMYIAHLVRRTVKTVDTLQVRIFQTGNRGCPVASVGNHQQGTRGKRGGSCKTVVQDGKQHRLRSSAGTTVHADACRVYILTVCQHIIQYQQSVHSLNGVRVIGMVRFRTYLQGGFPPTIQVIIHADSPHTCQSRHALLLVFAVASLSKMTIGADNQCMFAFGAGGID